MCLKVLLTPQRRLIKVKMGMSHLCVQFVSAIGSWESAQTTYNCCTPLFNGELSTHKISRT
jgi:hypothetical protein